MSATIRPTGILRSMVKSLPPGSETITVADGQQLGIACESLGLPLDLIALFMVNQALASKDYVLQAGDEVKLVAIAGGG